MSGPDLRPLDVEPVNVRGPFDQRRPATPSDPYAARSTSADREAALRDALAGMQLGDFDERMIRWLAGWDVPTVAAVVSLLGRVRAAGSDQ